MIDKKTEIEVKVCADSVSVRDFHAFCKQLSPTKYLYVEGPDTYYELNNLILRHRSQPDGNELTIKKRKHSVSARDRLEIDLFLRYNTAQEIADFLRIAGYKKLFVLYKKAHIFWFKIGKGEYNAVIYEVWEIKGKNKKKNVKRFIEIEVCKGSRISVQTAKKNLSALSSQCIRALRAGPIINQSLFEIYSSRKYGLV